MTAVRVRRMVFTVCAATVSVLVLTMNISGAEASKAVVPPSAAPLRFEKTRLVNSLNEGCAVADVNKDGRPDVIAGPHWFEGPTWRLHALREVGEVDNEFTQSNGDHAMDLNGDGWVDVMSASWFAPEICWYENPGKEGLLKGELWKRHLIIGGMTECEGTLLVDLNGDGVPELLPNRWNRDRPVTVIRITPGQSGQPPAFKEFEVSGSGHGHGMGAGDINGDGRVDLVFAHGWYDSPSGDPFAGTWTYHEAFGLSHTCLPCLVQDVNGDGRNDLLVGHAHDFGLVWLEQGPVQGGRTTWTPHEIDGTFSQAHCLVWADLDGDGRGELITGKRWRAHGDGDPGASQPVGLYRYVWNPSASRFERDTISFNEGIGGGMQIRAADLDGDKRLDLAVAGKTGTYVLLNRGPAKRD